MSCDTPAPEGGPVMEQYLYYADGSRSLVRIPPTGAPDLRRRFAERYVGPKDGWVGPFPAWTPHDPAIGSGRYSSISGERAAEIVADIDAIVPDTRDSWRFWPDRADEWTVARARKRAARLEAETGPNSSHWTINEYYRDAGELERLRSFLGGGSRPASPEPDDEPKGPMAPETPDRLRQPAAQSSDDSVEHFRQGVSMGW